MAEYRVVAAYADGSLTTIVQEAKNVDEAEALVLASGLTPVRRPEPVDLQGHSAAASALRFLRGSGVKPDDMVMCYENVAETLRTIPNVARVFLAEARRTRNSNLRRALNTAARDIVGGSSVADAMRRQTHVFGKEDVEKIASNANNVRETFVRLAEERRVWADFWSETKRQLVSPVVLLVTAVIIILTLFWFVVPMMKQFTTRLNIPKPWITTVVLGIADAVHGWEFWSIAALLFVTTAVSIPVLLRNTWVALFAERLLFRTPLIGPLFNSAVHMSMARTLADLLVNVSDPKRVLGLLAPTILFTTYRHAIEDVRVALFKGKSFAEAVEQTGVFDPLFVEYTLVGEESGSYDQPMRRCALRFDKEFRNMLAVAVKRIDPVITYSVLGATITILIALYAPYYVGLPAISDRIHGVDTGSLPHP